MKHATPKPATDAARTSPTPPRSAESFSAGPGWYMATTVMAAERVAYRGRRQRAVARGAGREGEVVVRT